MNGLDITFYAQGINIVYVSSLFFAGICLETKPINEKQCNCSNDFLMYLFYYVLLMLVLFLMLTFFINVLGYTDTLKSK